jgi:hypothetical protein
MDYYGGKNMEYFIFSILLPATFWVSLIILPLLLWISAIIAVMKGELKNEHDKILWLLILMFIPPLGMILFYTTGASKKNIINMNEQRIIKSEKMWPPEDNGQKGKWF